MPEAWMFILHAYESIYRAIQVWKLLMFMEKDLSWSMGIRPPKLTHPF